MVAAQFGTPALPDWAISDRAGLRHGGLKVVWKPPGLPAAGLTEYHQLRPVTRRLLKKCMGCHAAALPGNLLIK